MKHINEQGMLSLLCGHPLIGAEYVESAWPTVPAVTITVTRKDMNAYVVTRAVRYSSGAVMMHGDAYTEATVMEGLKRASAVATTQDTGQ